MRLPERGWAGVIVRSVQRFRHEDAGDRAAALTYYGLLALFPAFIALVALVGVLGGQSTVDEVLDAVESVGSEQAAETFRGPAESVVEQKAAAGALLGLGLLGAVWAASGYVGAFTRAMNAIWQKEEGRPFWKLRPYQLGLTLVLLIGAAVVLAAVAVSGSVADRAGDWIGLGDQAVMVWNLAKWPVLLLIVVLMVAILYAATPNVDQPRFRWLTPGAALAILTWLVASALFGLYVSTLGSYNATYGTLGGVVILLVWLWITNVALLVGAYVDVEIERERELDAGRTAAREEIQRPHREAPG